MVALVPTRTGIDELHGALQEAGIPAVFSGGRSFYARQEVLDTVHLLASLADPRDKGPWSRSWLSPAGVGNDDLLALCAVGLSESFTYLDVAAFDPPEAHPGLGGLAPEERRRVAGVLTDLAGCIDASGSARPGGVPDLRQALPVVEAWGSVGSAGSAWRMWTSCWMKSRPGYGRGRPWRRCSGDGRRGVGGA